MSVPGQYLFAIAAHDRVDLLDISAPYEPFNQMARREPPYPPPSLAPPNRRTTAQPQVAPATPPAWLRTAPMC